MIEGSRRGDCSDAGRGCAWFRRHEQLVAGDRAVAAQMIDVWYSGCVRWTKEEREWQERCM